MVDPLLQEMVRVVDEARTKAALAGLTLMAKQEEFKKWESEAYRAAADTKMACDAAEAALRTAAHELVAAAKGVTTMLPPGVGSRKIVDIDYDTKDAFQWAKEKGFAIILDVKTFEAIAANTTLPFVTKTPGFQITLTKDFKKAGQEAVS